MKREFFIECVPPKTTHQSSTHIMKTKAGRYFVGKSKKGQDVANELKTLFRLFRPPEPTAMPVKLKLCWHFPWRKNEPKKNRVHGSLPATTRPDLDNLAKGTIDAMSDFWLDDSLIVDLQVSKCWSDKTGIDVQIETIQPAGVDEWKWS